MERMVFVAAEELLEGNMGETAEVVLFKSIAISLYLLCRLEG
jgi:hypothetical protein